MSFKSICAAILLSTSFITTAHAAKCSNTGEGFPAFKAAVIKQAKKQGMSAEAIDLLSQTSYDQKVIKHDRTQTNLSQDFLTFQNRMAPAIRVKAGMAKIQQNQELFDRVSKEFGVPAPVIAAFWALETDFGATLGDFPTLQALMTLAWDCRRPEKFRPQLMAALSLITQGDLTVDQLRGAWAGEIGQTQFMAYDYAESAIDYDGDGKRNLRDSVPDVIASTANLLRKHGWKPNQPWLQEVKVTGELPWEQADIAIKHPRSTWAKWGVKSVSGKNIKADNFQASLLLPMGKDGPAFLAYDNFTTTYLKWNESLIYSATAAYLATRIAGAPVVSPGKGKVETLSYNEVVSLQKYLAAQGYDVGKIDGKIGKGTRAGVKDIQLKIGYAADGYPTRGFMRKLKESSTASIE